MKFCFFWNKKGEQQTMKIRHIIYQVLVFKRYLQEIAAVYHGLFIIHP